MADPTRTAPPQPDRTRPTAPPRSNPDRPSDDRQLQDDRHEVPLSDDGDLEDMDREETRREPPSIAHERERIRRPHEMDDEPALVDDDTDEGAGVEDEGLGRSDR